MKKITARMEKDSVQPYKDWGNKIPRVIESNHPRFVNGTRLDWGFVQVALEDGYAVEIFP